MKAQFSVNDPSGKQGHLKKVCNIVCVYSKKGKLA